MTFLFFIGETYSFGGPAKPAMIPHSPAYANGEEMTDVVPCRFPFREPMYLDDADWSSIKIM